MWFDVVVLAVWLSVVEAEPLSSLVLWPHFSFNIYPCLPAPSRRSNRPLLTENSITLGPFIATFTILN